jgi:hypothetical protein
MVRTVMAHEPSSTAEATIASHSLDAARRVLEEEDASPGVMRRGG